MMWLRRSHLYLGLLLFPWAILYGVTAFLFNHPTVFNDQPVVNFGKDSIAGTPLESLATPAQLAEEFLIKLNETRKPAMPYTLAGEAKFNREYSFATVKTEGQTISLLVDAKTGSGSIRSQVIKEKKEPETAPFVTGREAPSGGKKEKGPRNDSPKKVESTDVIRIEHPLHERFKAAIPSLLEQHGFASGEITITSVPDLVVPVNAEGKIWIANYNPMTGAVSGKPGDVKSETELGWRRFLLRLHTAHGYPAEINSRWGWAVIVDLMAFVLCFWGLSGLVMWWQLKQQRRLGIVLLAISAIAATVMGYGMHAAMAG